MNQNAPLIHVGYPKTGTTWFQKLFYTTVENSYFLKRVEVEEYITEPSVFEFDALKSRQLIQAKAGNKRLIICDELLLGGLDIGFGGGEFIYIVANRLRTIFPEAKIIIFIRNQISMIESSYCQYIKAGGTYSVNKYIGISRYKWHLYKEHGLFNPLLFDYGPIINLYESLFSKENVSVFLYEHFNANRQNFIINYCNRFKLVANTDFVSLNTNVRFTKFALCAIKFINYFTADRTYYKSFFFHLKGIWRLKVYFARLTQNIGKKYTFNEETKLWIWNFYRIKNQKLSERFGDDELIKNGYPL